MSSKEIVKEIKKIVGIVRAIKKRDDDDKWITIAEVKKEDVEQVEKDIEALEIIKGKLMWIENDKIYIGLQNDTYIELTEEDFDYDDRYRILKEWLKDEKAN